MMAIETNRRLTPAFCRRHGTELEIVSGRDYTGQRTPLRRCQRCVAEARAKVRLEQDRFARQHGSGFWKVEAAATP